MTDRPTPIKVDDLPCDISARLGNYWLQQIEAGEQLNEWYSRNSHPSFEAFDEEAQQASWKWRDELHSVTFRLGIPNPYSDRLRYDHFRKTWTLRVPTEGLFTLEGKPRIFEFMATPRLFLCRGCDELFLVDSGYGERASYTWRGVCSDACQCKANKKNAEIYRARRKERRAERSKQLANRQGRCCVCGDVFRLQRVTAKTCTPRCKKALQRNPERYAITEPPGKIKLSKNEVITIGEYVAKLKDAQYSLIVLRYKSGELTEEQQQRLQKIEKELDTYRPMVLNRSAFEQCQAIWLVDHPDALNKQE